MRYLFLFGIAVECWQAPSLGALKTGVTLTLSGPTLVTLVRKGEMLGLQRIDAAIASPLSCGKNLPFCAASYFMLSLYYNSSVKGKEDSHESLVYQAGSLLTTF